MDPNRIRFALLAFAGSLGASITLPAIASLRPNNLQRDVVVSSPQNLDRAVTVSLKNAGFSETLRILADECNLTVISNGQPLKQLISLTHKGSIKELLDQIGEEFDMNWSAAGKVIILAKRFTGDQDRPQLHVDELRASYRDALKALPRLRPVAIEESGPRYGWAVAIRDFWGRLDPEVQAALQSGKHIPISQLPPAYQQALQTIVDHRAFGEAIRMLDRTVFILDGFAVAHIASELIGTFTPPMGAASQAFRVAIIVSTGGRKESEPIGSLRRTVPPAEKRELQK